MTREPIKSSNLKSVGYDSNTHTLEVEFHSGAVHQYSGVPVHHHTGLTSSLSPGQYFHQHIRSGKFHSREVPAPASPSRAQGNLRAPPK